MDMEDDLSTFDYGVNDAIEERTPLVAKWERQRKGEADGQGRSGGRGRGGGRGGRGRGRGRQGGGGTQHLPSDEEMERAARSPFLTSTEIDVFDRYGEKIGRPMEKRFDFRYKDLKEPPPESIFQASTFEIDTLQRRKHDLNHTKSKLDELDIAMWGNHTKFTSLTDFIVSKLRSNFQPEFATIAWCKMYEMLDTFRLVPQPDEIAPDGVEIDVPFCSVHICEAPGAFIAATNHMCVTKRPGMKWEWLGNSLNPHFEGNDPKAMIDDDRFINKTKQNWVFGKDGSGDIMKRGTIEELQERAKEMNGPVMLVTADGSINCQDNPNEQETTTAPLHYCEVVAAFAVLAKGGNAVFKLFTMFEDHTAGLLYLLATHFDALSVCKPTSSKAGNSETYAVARGFKGVSTDVMTVLMDNVGPSFPVSDSSSTSQTLFARDTIGDSFMSELKVCASLFGELQRSIIERNLHLFKQMSDGKRHDILDEKQRVATGFFYRYRIRALPRGWSVAEKTTGGQSVRLDGSEATQGRSFTLRSGEGDGAGTLADRQMIAADVSLSLTIDDSGNGEPQTKRKRLSEPVPTPAPAPSIGMTMLKKMGYEEGEGLGKEQQGMKEAIQPVQRSDKIGLGHVGGSGGAADLISAGLSGDLNGLYEDEPPRWLTLDLEDSVTVKCAESLKSKSKSGDGDGGISIKTANEPPTVVRITKFCSKKVLDELYAARHLESGHSTTWPCLQHPMENRTLELLKNLNAVCEIIAPGFSATVIDAYSADSAPVASFIKSVSPSLSPSPSIVHTPPNTLTSDIVASSTDTAQLLLGDALVDDSSTEHTVANRLLYLLSYALRTLGEDGNLVIRMREAHMRYTCGLVYLVYHMFTAVTIVKPSMSLQPSCERFLVAKGFKPSPMVDTISEHLRDGMKLIEEEENKEAIHEIVDVPLMLNDTVFAEFLINRNEVYALRESKARVLDSQ